MKKRIDWLDECKGMTIILVVLGHVISGYMNSGLYINEQRILTTIFNIIYSFHMALFFILSGYLFYVAYRKKIFNAKVQVIDLVFIYFIFSIFFGFMKLGASNITITSIGLIDILRIPIQPIGEFWYLYTLIWFYILMIWIDKKSIDTNATLFISCCASLLSSRVADSRICNLLCYFLFFYFGYWLAYNKNRLSKLIIFLSVMISIVSLFLTIQFGIEIRTMPIISSIVALSYSISILFIFQLSWHSKLLNYLGRHSLDIYIWHSFFTAFIRSIFIRMNINLCISILINFMMSLVIPFCIVYTMKKLDCYDVIMKPYKYIRSTKI